MTEPAPPAADQAPEDVHSPGASGGTDASGASEKPISGRLLVALGLLSAVAPFATDLYLPAFPQMTVELATSATLVQLTLTAFLVGITVGQLVFGPLSDRFGRRLPLLCGSALCVVASIVAAVAPTVDVLIAARLFQGLGGAAGMVIGRAVVSDLARGRQAARAFSLMMIVSGVAPVVAPLAGGVLTGPIGWRGLLTIVLGLAIVMLAVVIAVVPESHPKERRLEHRAMRQQSGSPLAALRSRTYIGYAGTYAFAFAVLMAYISASPFVYQTMMGLSALQYGISFGVNSLGLVLVSMVSARLTATRSVPGLLTVGIAMIVTAAVVVGVLVTVSAPPGWLAVPLFVTVSGMGLVFGNATALALAAVPAAAGTASAVLGAVQFGLAAIVAPLVGIRGEGTAAPLAVIMVLSASIAAVLLAVARWRPVSAP